MAAIWKEVYRRLPMILAIGGISLTGRFVKSHPQLIDNFSNELRSTMVGIFRGDPNIIEGDRVIPGQYFPLTEFMSQIGNPEAPQVMRELEKLGVPFYCSFHPSVYENALAYGAFDKAGGDFSMLKAAIQYTQGVTAVGCFYVIDSNKFIFYVEHEGFRWTLETSEQ